MTKKLTPKVPADNSVIEELRVLNAATENDTSKDWLTPELISMVSSVVVNLATAATVVGWIDATSAQELTKAVTTMIAAVGTIGANALIVWRYLAGRATVKTETIQAHYRYMEVVAAERFRALPQ